MSIFANPFFSIAGQQERVSNVGNTLLAAVTGKGVKSNTGSAGVDKILSYAASNPFTTALVGAGAINPSALGGTLKAGFNALPASGKAATIVAAPIVIGAVSSNPGLVAQAGTAPSQLSEFGKDIGAVTKNPTVQGFKDVFVNSPVLSTGTALLGIAAIGGGTAAAISTIANTRAIKENTRAINAPTAPVGVLPTSPAMDLPTSPQSGTIAAPQEQPLTPETQVLGKEVKSPTRSIAKRRSTPKASIANAVRVNIFNQNTYI